MVELRIGPMFDWLEALNKDIDPTYGTDGLKRLYDWNLPIPDLAAVCQRVADLYGRYSKVAAMWSPDDGHRERYELLFNWYVRRQAMRVTRGAPVRDEFCYELYMTNGARDPGWQGLQRMHLVPDYGLDRIDLARLLEVHARKHGYVDANERFNLVDTWYEHYRMVFNEKHYENFIAAYRHVLERPMEVTQAIMLELPK